MDPPEESVLEAVLEDGETLDDDGDLVEDVEMLDAETLDNDRGHHPQEPGVNAAQQDKRGGSEGDVGVACQSESGSGGSGMGTAKRKKRRNKKGKRSRSDMRITDINRFVIDTCRHLREKKSYLVWNAVGCLGVSVVNDLVKEVDAIQSCGGQKTADGSRFRTGGGILWNILRTREPKAYKEIMAKGREFEKQFRHHRTSQVRERNAVNTSPRPYCETSGPAEKEPNDPRPEEAEAAALVESNSVGVRESVLNRMRVPVAYDDLFEEGEIV